ncbi:ABC-F family ATP-binding cassette domain-containing protein [Shewanella sp. VB17]|uniref:ATP-binding cassette domain-containing protein n=1 Tax=Shewanella sp. VB17 TaxID=2739432 RepID=UPI0015665E74|nr:ATP-binding cassette domain-containing protein [Shewanella sp. VB17]NRD75267.1 ABC-F family ATP-binding cassette domain-containing protein [Shewanella sp. VB17]
MPTLITHQLSFQLDTGEWLFNNICFNLNSGISGLIGRNGVGKSVFISVLNGKLAPTQGHVTCQGHIAYYSQLPADLLEKDVRIADFLGITNKLLALRALEQGRCELKYFDDIGDDWDIETQTKHTLRTLQIDVDLNDYCHTLSGGQLAMLQLHQLFQANSDILLLDEPSNHLDTQGKHWLISQLQQYKGKVLLISHDKHLLRHVDHIYSLTSLGLDLFKGHYDDYITHSCYQANALNRQISHVKSQQKKIARQAQANKEKSQQREVQGNRIRKSGSQAKVIMGSMKDKAGQSLSRLATNQQNQSARNQHKLHALQAMQEILQPQAFHLQTPEQVKKKTLLTIENYRLNKHTKKTLTFSLSYGARCHLSGANGCGKSTLLKTIHHKDNPYSGVIKHNTKTVYLDQHFGLLKVEGAILDSLMKRSKNLTESDARTLLARIGFRKDSVYRQVGHLSGGEKMKLSMLIISQISDSPLLLLDEPDNHLDIESTQILAAALSAYQGAFILVSHDEDFVNEVRISERIIMN